MDAITLVHLQLRQWENVVDKKLQQLVFVFLSATQWELSIWNSEFFFAFQRFIARTDGCTD